MRGNALLSGFLILWLATGCLSTPVQQPSTTQEIQEEEIVQTVEGADSYDVRELYEMHRQTLANTSGYTIQQNYSKDGLNVRQRQLHVSFDEQRAVLKVASSRETRTEFINETGTFVRYTPQSTNETTFDEQTSTGDEFSAHDSFSSMVQPPLPGVVSSFDYEYTGNEGGEYIFTADSLKPPSETEYTPWVRANVSHAESRLVIDERGFIQSYSSTVTLDTGQIKSSHFQYQVQNVNQTQVAQPTWNSSE